MYKVLTRASAIIEVVEDMERYDANIISTNGTILQPYDTSTTLIGSVLKNNVDITSSIKNIKWTKWNPTKDNLVECPEWNQFHIGKSTIVISKTDIDSKSIFVFEAYSDDDKLLCSASISLVDINDLLVSTDKPTNPYIGQLWIDDSTDPASLYAWNGYKWVLAGAVGALVKNLLRNTAYVSGVKYWDTVGDPSLSYIPRFLEYIGHKMMRINSDVISEYNRGISQNTLDEIKPNSQYSFQMLFYSKNNTETYSNKIWITAYSINKENVETAIYGDVVEADVKIQKVFARFKTLQDTDKIKIEIIGESDHRFDFYMGELALYNTWNEYEWTINPSDLKSNVDFSQEDIWNILSNNGTSQGIFAQRNPETGQLDYYINATYIAAGQIKAQYMEMYGLKVLRKDKDGNPTDIATLEITEDGDVNLNVNKLVIKNTGQSVEEALSDVNGRVDDVELAITPEGIQSTVVGIVTENGTITEHFTSISEQTADHFSTIVKNELTEQISEAIQTAEGFTNTVKNELEGQISEAIQTAEGFTTTVKDELEGQISEAIQTAEGFTTTVRDELEGQISEAIQTAEGFTTTVRDELEGQISEAIQTAEGFTTTVRDELSGQITSVEQTAAGLVSTAKDELTGHISTVEQTASGLLTRMENAENDIAEINITAEGIETIVQDAKDNITKLNVTAEGIKSEVADANKNISQFEQTAKGFASKVEDASKNLSQFEQTAKGFTTTVTNAEGAMSDYKQTVDGFTKAVKDADGNITTFTQTANKLSGRLEDVDKNIGSIEVTATSLTSKFENFEGDYSEFKQDAEEILNQVTDKKTGLSALMSITKNGVYLAAKDGDNTKSLVDINQNAITLKSNQIKLEGYTTVNSGFSIDLNGKMKASGGTFNGTITGSTIQGGSLGIGGDKNTDFRVDSNGNCYIKKGSITLGTSENFKVTSDGVLTAKSANFSGTITGSTIKSTKKVSSDANANPVFSVSSEGEIVGAKIDCFNINAEGLIATESLSVNRITNSRYPQCLDESITINIDPSAEDNATDWENGSTFKSFEDMYQVVPRNLNGYTITINLKGNYHDNILLDRFNGGHVYLFLHKHTVYGYLYVTGMSMRYTIYGNYKGEHNGKDYCANIKPGLGFGESGFSFGCYFSYTNVIAYDLNIYKAATNQDSDSGMMFINLTRAWLCNINAYNKPTHLVRCEANSHVYVHSSSGATHGNTFSSWHGSVLSLRDVTHAGCATNNVASYFEKYNGQVLRSGATFSTSALTGTNDTTVPSSPAISKTVTLVPTSANAYRRTVYNSWKNDGLARQGDWGYGNCVGLWFFGSQIDNYRNKSVTAVSITLTRIYGGYSSAVSVKLVGHSYSSRPSGNPVMGEFIKSISIAANETKTVNLTKSEIDILKKYKGIGIVSAYDAPSYAVCSTCKIRLTFKE